MHVLATEQPRRNVGLQIYGPNHTSETWRNHEDGATCLNPALPKLRL